MDSVELCKDNPKKDINKCIFCGSGGRKGNDKRLSSSTDRIAKIWVSSQKLKDDLLPGLTDEDIHEIRYHTQACYAPYVLLANRTSVEDDSAQQVEETNTPGQEQNTRPSIRPQDVSPMQSPEPPKKPCVICNHVKHNNETIRHRKSEKKHASNFIAAYTFNKDDVYRRCIFLKKLGDIYAADIYVHNLCIKKYIKRYWDELLKLQAAVTNVENDLSNEAEIQEAIGELCENLKLESQAYKLSKCREEVNLKLKPSGLEINNRVLESKLVARFSDQICFTYPKDVSLSQMFFSVNIQAADIAETFRSNDAIKICGNILHDECKAYNFSLKNAYRDATDLSISYDIFKQNRPVQWEKFLKSLWTNIFV